MILNDRPERSGNGRNESMNDLILNLDAIKMNSIDDRRYINGSNTSDNSDLENTERTMSVLILQANISLYKIIFEAYYQI